MKNCDEGTRTGKVVLGLILASGLVWGSKSTAADPHRQIAVLQTLASVPAPELPVLAAELVKAAEAGARAERTVQVVQAAAALNPSVTPMVVGAIAKAVPEMAGLAAGTAARLQPKQATAAARSAAAAAPAMAGQIVAAVCQANPKEFRSVALAVAQAAPAASRNVLDALASVFPEFQAAVHAALSGTTTTTPSVSAVMASFPSPPTAAGMVTGSAAMRGLDNASSLPQPPPAMAPLPVIPHPPSSIVPSGSGSGPRGGRNYAAP
jgi:hypothetical protein